MADPDLLLQTSPAYTATGIGAFATGPPSATPGAPTPTSSSSSSSSTSSSPPTPTHTAGSSDAAVIVGGTIGGFLALSLVVILFWFLYRISRRKEARVSPFDGGAQGVNPYLTPQSPVLQPFVPDLSPVSAQFGPNASMPIDPRFSQATTVNTRPGT